MRRAKPTKGSEVFISPMSPIRTKPTDKEDSMREFVVIFTSPFGKNGSMTVVVNAETALKAREAAKVILTHQLEELGQYTVLELKGE